MQKLLMIFLATGCFLLASCGFHLRGSQSTIKNVSVHVNVNGQRVSPFVAHELKQQLATRDDASRHLAILNVPSAAFKKRVIVLDAEARPAELALIFQLDYTLKIDEETAKAGVITTDKNYFFDAMAIASTDHYEKIIQKQLIQQAASILRRTIQHQMEIIR